MSIKWYNADCIFDKLKMLGVVDTTPNLNEYNSDNIVNYIRLSTNKGLRIYEVRYPERIIRNNVTFERFCKLSNIRQIHFDECVFSGTI